MCFILALIPIIVGKIPKDEFNGGECGEEVLITSPIYRARSLMDRTPGFGKCVGKRRIRYPGPGLCQTKK